MTRHVTLVACLAAATALPALAQDDGQSTDLPLAVQMFTLRDYGDFDRQLQAVADAGVTRIETFGMDERDAEDVRQMLDAHGIEVISDHVSIDRLRDDLDAVVAFNRTVGNDTIVMPYLAEEIRPTDADGWRALGTELAGIAAALSDQEMRLGYHNHDFEIAEFDGRTALELIFEAAGPDLLAEVDLAWVARGGHDPATYLETIGDRVFAVHAKDNKPDFETADERGFETVGSGTLDWDAILPAAQAVGVEYYIIEHDAAAAPAENIAASADFLREALPRAMPAAN